MSKEFDHIKHYCDNGSLTFDKSNNVLYFNNTELVIQNREGKYSSTRFAGRVVNVHRIIAYLKYGDEYCYPITEARHLNDVKNDYSWSNIAIGTHKENMHDIPQEVWDRIHAVGIPALHAQDRSKRAKHWWASLTPEERSERGKHIALVRESNMPFEVKSERSKKGWLKKSGKTIGAAISAAHARRSPEAKLINAKAAHDGLGTNQLTIEQALEAKVLFATGNYNYRDIALMFNCHYNTIKSVIRATGRYAHIEGQL